VHETSVRHWLHRGIGALLLAALLLPALASAADLQVYLARHAEKDSDDPRDPSLSAAGSARAQALAESLRHAGLQAVYATQYRRTRQTAAPAAAMAGVAVTVRPASGGVATDAAAFAAELRERHPEGGAVLVVGHSNTIPALAQALLGDAAPVASMAEDAYDRLLLVTLPGQAPPRVLVARYGAPSAHP
jgi:broad specificity phosphatase PhoE